MTEFKGQITGLASPFLESWRMNIIKKYVTGGKILDFGCGRGRFVEILPFENYLGVDIDSRNIDIAKVQYSRKKNIAFLTNEEFFQVDQKFDFIILSAVVEHFDDPKKRLEELTNRLNVRGRIIITTPTEFGNKILLIGSKIKIFSKEAFEEHNQIFSKTDFIELSELLNLNLIEYFTFEFGMNQLAVLSRDN
jgi:2-polyprenyl-3-methyl-5-hydroxy-6-metoxy-1,4-benzoquinol methylase